MLPQTSESESQSPLIRRQNESPSSVQVAVRVRPMLANEKGSTQCIEILRGADSSDAAANVVRIGGESGPTFAFDEAFGVNTSQGHLFDRRIAPLVQSCMDGYNATCLAYGQTGSGKTFSMLGPESTSLALHDDMAAGVIPRALRDLFDRLEKVREQCSLNKENQPQDADEEHGTTYEYEVRVQFLELYGEDIRDLLTPSSTERLTIRDVGVEEPEVLGATKHKVESAEDALLCLTRGMMRRVTGATAMNSSSSRSHAILSVLVEQTTTFEEESPFDGSCGEDTHGVQHVQVKRSKFNFVDLAGSERQKRTKAEGQRLKEGIEINKGLLVLGNVISALGDPKKIGKAFVPYRDSKLTRLLKGSLGGNHKTLMIACVSPSSNNLEESLNCLRYANRAKNIQNNAIVNVDAGSRLVAELRQQVQALATDLLRVKQGDTAGGGTFTIETLKTLASGSDSTGVELLSGSRPPASNLGTTSPSTVASGFNQTIVHPNEETEVELESTREQLRQAQVSLLTTSEALHVSKAEKELYRLQLSALSSADDTPKGDMDAVFLQRSVAYEKEISSLKDALRKASVPTELDIEQSSSESPRTSPKDPQTPSKDDSAITTLDSPEFVRLHSRVLQSLSHEEQLDAEERAETDEINTITKKYLDDDDRVVDVKETPSNNVQGALSSDGVGVSNRQTKQMEAQLLEISRSIEAKEDLISQLQLSQERYAAMREFYEDKLHQMEEQVKERESEREQLVLELEKMEESNSCTKDLQDRLKDKEKHIAGLRKKQRELVALTKVSGRNESEIGRLRNEVVAMKQKKVEMQKLIATERKSHAAEIQQLKKQTIQREREATKWKRVSDRKAAEAEKAQQVAKARLEQVGQLRSKYKEAERKLRVRVMKRGVMEKAGLDPVIVGRRDSKRRQVASGAKRAQVQKERPEKSAVDYDAIRSLLDQKVAEVGRKEAIADKLANEWEDHLELVSQREASVLSTSATKETLESLDVQIQYKEERIRQLAQRLGKVDKKRGTREPFSDASFLEETAFRSILGNKSPLVACKATARVLFGMVVRERRRVASLARTASSLDEKAVEAEKCASTKDAALRSYMEEERRERESMAQSQQEQILSLMSMVQEQETTFADVGDSLSPESSARMATSRVASSAGAQQSTVNASVMVLANERISALQHQVEELQGDCRALEAYKQQETDTRSLLLSKEEETEGLRQQLNTLRTSLRQIRETLSSPNIGEQQDNELSHAVLGIIMDALHPSHAGQPSSPSRKLPLIETNKSRQPKVLSPRLKRHVELMHTSDSEDGEIPEWAGDIMTDLAIIARDEVPPSLRDIDVSPAVLCVAGKEGKEKNGSVFDRLTNPDSFTGVQKQKTTRKKRASKPPSSDGVRGGQEERRALSRSVTESLEKITIPSEETAFGSDGSNGDKELSKAETPHSVASSGKSDDSRSVFDRLLSPSNYTGIHAHNKEKVHQKSERQKDRDTSVEPDTLLDELLGSDAETTETQFEETAAAKVLSSKVSDYTQQNVFERLQRTTTQSYAVKHSHTPIRSPTEFAQNHAALHVDEIVSHEDVPMLTAESNIDHSEYYRQNVFERLQKTTTQAYAKKTKSGDKEREV